LADCGAPPANSSRAARASRTWLVAALRKEKRPIGAVLGMGLVATGLSLLSPYLTKILIDRGLLMRNAHVITLTCLVMVGVAMCAMALQRITLVAHTRVSGRVLFGLRTRVFEHLLTLSPDWHARHNVGDTLSRLDGDIGEIQRYAVDTLLTMLNAMFALIVSFSMMLSLDVRLALVITAIIPGQLLCLHLLRRRIADRNRDVRESASRIASFLYDSLVAVKYIQSTHSEARRAGQLREKSAQYLDSVVRMKLAGMTSVSVPGLITTITMATVFVVGGHALVNGSTSIGTLVALTAYLTRATAPLTTLLSLYVSTRRIQVSLDRVETLLSAQPAVRPPAIPVRLPPQDKGSLEFKNVRFSYPAGTGPVLRDANLRILPGAKIGIVGRSGAGKTTLVDLLIRHYDPEQGDIYLDGVKLGDIEFAELRHAVAVVSQDTPILSGTIAENIAGFDPGVARESIINAARAAGVHAEIIALPQGYDSILNTRGDILSGGQRQRVALARLFLQRPRVLILDEAISAVDSRAAAELTVTIDQLFSQTTRIIVSHRAEPLRNVDALYEIDQGQFSCLTPLRGVQHMVSGVV
jgi:ATP-binding cassette, subfamily B, bacterial